MKRRPFCFAALLIVLAYAPCIVAAEQPPVEFSNPVIPGFHPDPSVIRVGEDYYLVNSSFEWFPGIPIFHSRDLVNWRQIGHALNRRSQLNMVANKPSSGVWAPTIRYHDGTFYIIVTCKQCGTDKGPNPGWNLYVTADKPEGPYSDPVFVNSPRGIDPSLFFDEDKVWFSANRFPEKPRYPAEHIVYTQQIDIETGRLKGELYDITAGMEYGVRATEGPHQYKVNDRYYLLTAEDMTWEKHMVVSYVADQAQGPYQLLPGNPVLSHRDKPASPVQHTGHADLVQTQNGEWWSVLLGVRKLDGHYYLGRETFLAPASWQEGTLLLGDPAGEVRMSYHRPDLPWTPWPAKPDLDTFDSKQLDLAWNFLRTPQSQWWSLEERPGWLRIDLRPVQTTQLANPSLVARRFQHHRFLAASRIDFQPRGEHDEAGLIAIQNDRFQYRLAVTGSEGHKVLKLIKVFNEDRKVLSETVVAQRDFRQDGVLAMKLDGLELQFLAGPGLDQLEPLGDVQDASVLASNVSGGFIGAFVGLYASSGGRDSDNTADFDWFLYQPDGEQ